MHSFASDVRQTIRSLRTSPGLVAVSVLSLGLGLGVNLAVFTAIQTIFFHEPSLADPSRVYAVQPGNSNQLSYLNYRDLRDSGIVETAAGSRGVTLNLRTGTQTTRADGVAVTANFFEFVGIPPALGRTFSEAEGSPDRQPRVAVLSHAFWQRQFNADPSIIGREVTINGQPFAVLGVMPEGYRAVTIDSPSVYVPISSLVLPTVNARNNGNALAVLVRLRAGTTREQLQVALTNLGQQLERSYPRDNEGMSAPAKVISLRGGELADSTAQFVAPAVLMSLFGLVLLSACANVAGLLLARATGRQREIAIRVALGARRSQVVRLLLTESFGLATLGTVVGIVLSLWLMRLLNVLSVPGNGPLNLGFEPSTAMAAYALALLAVTGLLCGIAPALRTTKRDVTAVIQGGGSPGVTGRLRLRHAFVVGQVAACLILLVLSSLMLRSLTRVMTMDTGFDVDRGVVATVFVDAERYAIDGGLPLGERLVERLTQLPGVESASFANILALGTDRSARGFEVPGSNNGRGPRAYVNSVAPRYFETVGVPIVRGRDFNASDRQGGPPVAIVTEAFERGYFPGTSALGNRIRGSQGEPYFQIVGVVRDHMYGGYGDAATPVFYSSYLQQPRVSTQVRPVVIHIRTGSPGALLGDVRRTVASVDPALSFEVQTLRQATGSEPAIRRFGTQLLAAAGGLGLLLAAIGLYGTMAFVVATRTSEIGLRMAIGATTAQVLRGVLSQGMTLVGLGLAIGTVLSLAIAQVARGMLAGLNPADPITFIGTALLLMLVGVTACYMPARRAASVNPIVALRRL